ncbi:MAG TPA: hypothetical protein VF519_18875 [Mycobacteriales bacterium]|jgi:hypothetical protein
MRRPLLLLVLAVAAGTAAVPANAANDICFYARTEGTAIPHRETGTTCTDGVWPWGPHDGIYCEVGGGGVYPDAWIEYQYCAPPVIPI